MGIFLCLCSCCCLLSAPARADYGKASYYGPEFHGRKTASGEVYDRGGLTCAHKDLPFGTTVKVTNLANMRSVIVRVNDRGPWIKGRIIDLSYAAAQKIDMIREGVIDVKIEVVK